MRVRIAKDEPDFLPPNGRIQLGGVGANWGKTTFEHLTDLADDGLTDELLCARNPSGNTHEDIDAIFALFREKLANSSVMAQSGSSSSCSSSSRRASIHRLCFSIFDNRRSATHCIISAGSIRRRGGALRPRPPPHSSREAHPKFRKRHLFFFAIYLKWQNLSIMTEIDFGAYMYARRPRRIRRRCSLP